MGFWDYACVILLLHEVSQSRYYLTYILFWDVLSSYQYKLHIEP